jgi:hypothetical protein
MAIAASRFGRCGLTEVFHPFVCGKRATGVFKSGPTGFEDHWKAVARDITSQIPGRRIQQSQSGEALVRGCFQVAAAR